MHRHRCSFADARAEAEFLAVSQGHDWPTLGSHPHTCLHRQSSLVAAACCCCFQAALCLLESSVTLHPVTAQTHWSLPTGTLSSQGRMRSHEGPVCHRHPARRAVPARVDALDDFCAIGAPDAPSDALCTVCKRDGARRPKARLPADLKLALAQELAVAHVHTTALEEAYSQPPSAWLVSSVTSGSDGETWPHRFARQAAPLRSVHPTIQKRRGTAGGLLWPRWGEANDWHETGEGRAHIRSGKRIQENTAVRHTRRKDGAQVKAEAGLELGE